MGVGRGSSSSSSAIAPPPPPRPTGYTFYIQTTHVAGLTGAAVAEGPRRPSAGGPAGMRARARPTRVALKLPARRPLSRGGDGTRGVPEPQGPLAPAPPRVWERPSPTHGSRLQRAVGPGGPPKRALPPRRPPRHDSLGLGFRLRGWAWAAGWFRVGGGGWSGGPALLVWPRLANPASLHKCMGAVAERVDWIAAGRQPGLEVGWCCAGGTECAGHMEQRGGRAWAGGEGARRDGAGSSVGGQQGGRR